MTSIALVLLALGLLFATLQYPALMKRFWKWTLISGASVALLVAAAVIVIIVRENSTTATHGPWEDYAKQGGDKPNPFDQFDGKPNDWIAPSETQKEAPTIVKPEYYDGNGHVTVKSKVWDGNSLEERIDQALKREPK
jgi:hypothetical protein